MTTKRDRAAPPVDNYSKPVGWWCSRGFTWSSLRHHAEECWGDYPCLAQLIPVYTPLTVPEVTTWGASGGDEAVCCEHIECVDGSGGGGVLDYSLGSDVWRDRAASIYDDGEVLIHEPVDVRGLSFAYSPCADVASAIRFAAGDDGGLYYNKGEVMTDEKDSRVTATIEPDDCKSGMWMVVLREGNGKLIGIPLRGADYKTVVFSRQSLGFAFEYGAKHVREVAVKEMNRHWWSVTTPYHEEP